jgi:predicted nucleic acid-binding protein
VTYLDASVLLRWLLGESGRLEPAKVTQPLTSALAEVEIFRTLDRLRIRNALTPSVLADLHESAHDLLTRIDLIRVSADILARAAQPFPTVLGTLDALHLSTALLWQRQAGSDSLLFATHDEQVGLAARASGFAVIGL